jgi:hypothetical protein
MPLRCTKAASVILVHSLMFNLLSPTKCTKSASTTGSYALPIILPLHIAHLALGKHALHAATLPLITVFSSSQGKSATVLLELPAQLAQHRGLLGVKHGQQGPVAVGQHRVRGEELPLSSKGHAKGHRVLVGG